MRNAFDNLVVAVMVIACVMVLVAAAVVFYAIVALSAVVVTETITERLARYRDSQVKTS